MAEMDSSTPTKPPVNATPAAGKPDPGVAPRRPATWSLFLALGVAALVVAVTTWGIVEVERRREISSWEARLMSLATERQQRVEEWVSERCADAQMIAGYPSIVRVLRQPAEHPENEPTPIAPSGHLAKVLDLSMRTQRYERIYLSDRHGHVVVDHHAGKESTQGPREDVRRAVESETPTVRFVTDRPTSATASTL